MLSVPEVHTSEAKVLCIIAPSLSNKMAATLPPGRQWHEWSVAQCNKVSPHSERGQCGSSDLEPRESAKK